MSSVAKSRGFEAYIDTLRLVFGGVPWAQIEGYAAIAWQDCGLSQNMPWKKAAVRVREAFNAAQKQPQTWAGNA